jgi:hypothetical protein
MASALLDSLLSFVCADALVSLGRRGLREETTRLLPYKIGQHSVVSVLAQPFVSLCFRS